MTSDPYAKAQPGDKLTIHAAAWNRVIDMVKPQAAASPGEEFSYQRTNFRVHCQNSTGDDVPQWGVLGIQGILDAPTGTSSSWSWPGIVGGLPTGPSATGVSYVIAVEPIQENAIGQAAIAGVVQARVLVRCTGHQYATPKSSEVNYLETSEAGPFRIIWKGNTGPANPTGVTGPTKPWALLAFDYERPLESIQGHSTGSIQLLGHGKPTTGASGCDGGLAWYSVSECSGNPSYATSYFL